MKIGIPAALVRCPCCGSSMVVEVDAWETESGRAIPTGVAVECDAEPTRLGSSWRRWFRRHYADPCETRWLELRELVLEWLSSHVRFEERRA